MNSSNPGILAPGETEPRVYVESVKAKEATMQEKSPAQSSRMTGSLPPPSCRRESGGSKGGRHLMDQQPGREVRAEVPGG